MRPFAAVLGLALVAVACKPSGTPAPGPDQGLTAAVNVLPLANTSYPTMGSIEVARLRMLPCPTTGGPGGPPTNVGPGGGKVGTPGGDTLTVPPGGVPGSTQFKMFRPSLSPTTRAVEVTSGEPLTAPATLSIHVGDCGASSTARLTILRQVRDNLWEDVGGTVSPDRRSVSARLDHLSIYAVATE